jgi:hypothetical protein
MRLRAAAALVALAQGLPAAWIESKSGPFFLFSDSGDGAARAALNHLEQFRWMFGESLGIKDPRIAWPVTVVVVKPAKTIFAPAGVPAPEPLLGFSRDGWLIVWPAGAAPSPAFFRQLGQLLLDDNLKGRMPGDLEAALASLFSTMTVKESRVTIGAPPAQAERTRSWAMFHYLLLNPETAVRSRALMANLAAGGEPDAAFRNAFGQDRKAIDAKVDAYLAAGQFAAQTVAGRPINLDLAFPTREALPSRIRLLGGDVLLVAGAAPTKVRAAYQSALNDRASPGGQEGLALALLAEKDTAAARPLLEAMAASDDAGARGLLELARLETDKEKARQLMERASKKNPQWADPYVALAGTEAGPVRRAYWLEKAAALSPRNPDLWKALAEAQFDAKQFPNAGRSWRAAERAARNDAERESLEQARVRFEDSRAEAEAAERARLRKEERDEVERVRQDNLASIRAAEEKANRERGGPPSGPKPEKWWEGPPLSTIEGVLERVDCTGKTARLNVRNEEGTLTAFAVPDAGKLLVFGAGGATTQLACGAQRPPRRVKIEYEARPKPQPGMAVTIEFR